MTILGKMLKILFYSIETLQIMGSFDLYLVGPHSPYLQINKKDTTLDIIMKTNFIG